MKQYFQLAVLIAVCLLAGAYLHKCQTPAPDAKPEDACVTDTVTYIDTIPYYEPAHVGSRLLGSVKLSARIHRPDSASRTAVGPPTAPDSVYTVPDSVEVEIPITQKEYEGEFYHAWISGYDPKMDSIHVFPRHETITIREPPERRSKRWGVGVFAGYGITPKGLQPCVGVSINYNLWNFNSSVNFEAISGG